MTLQAASVAVPMSLALGATEHPPRPPGTPASGTAKAPQSPDSSWGIGGGGETMIQQDMNIMRIEMIGKIYIFIWLAIIHFDVWNKSALLERLAHNLPNSKEKVVFLINNFDQANITNRLFSLPENRAFNFFSCL